MRFHRPSFKFIAVAALGLFLAGAPQPAYALDLGGALSSMLSFLTGMFNSLIGVTKDSSAQNIAAQKLQNDTMQKIADYNAQATDKAALKNALAAAGAKNQPSDDLTCQLVANHKNQNAHDVAEREVMKAMNSLLAQTYIDPNSGNVIGETQITTCLCNLGATGKNKAGCKIDGDEANGLVGGDWSPNVAIFSHYCIPMKQEVFPALTACIKNGTVPGDSNLKKALVAILNIRVNRRLSLGRVAQEEESKTLDGKTNAAEMMEKVTTILASAQPILRALAYKSCPAKAMLPGCDKDEGDLVKRLGQLANAKTLEMPPSGGEYCLSGDLRRLAYNEQALYDAAHVDDLEGDKATKHQVAADEIRDMEKLNARGDEIVVAGADAASKDSNYRAPNSNRPVGNSSTVTSENDLKELLDSIRELTRVIQQQQGKLPRALEVKATPPAGSKTEAAPRAGSAAALPPLRQDFPTVE